MRRVDFEEGELQAVATLVDAGIKSLGIEVLNNYQVGALALNAMQKINGAKEIKPRKKKGE